LNGARVVMDNGRMKIVVGKWGKISLVEGNIFQVDEDNELSQKEYECLNI